MAAIKGELDGSEIYLNEEVERFSAVYFKPKQRQSAMDHQAMNAALDPAVSRFTVRQQDNEKEVELWRGKARALLNLYGSLGSRASVSAARQRRLGQARFAATRPRPRR